MVDRKHDVDPQETREWLDALESVLRNAGAERGHELIERLVDHARRSGVNLPYSARTAYVNTIHASQEPPMPGEPGLDGPRPDPKGRQEEAALAVGDALDHRAAGVMRGRDRCAAQHAARTVPHDAGDLAGVHLGGSQIRQDSEADGDESP